MHPNLRNGRSRLALQCSPCMDVHAASSTKAAPIGATQGKRARSVPVIANGDVTSYEDAKQILEESGADGLMIGRGAQGAPLVSQTGRILPGDRQEARAAKLGGYGRIVPGIIPKCSHIMALNSVRVRRVNILSGISKKLRATCQTRHWHCDRHCADARAASCS